MKKISIIILTIICVLLVGCKKENTETKYSIITTNFSSYDFVRAIIKDVDNIDVDLLLKPGSETHDYEPTPQDIINIGKSDLFIYVGGESDSWIDSVLNNIDTNKTKVIKLMDYVDLFVEETVEGMEEEEDEDEIEYDEHIWTSPINAIKITKKLYEEIKNIDSNNKDKYEENTNKYVEELNDIDKEIKNIISTSKRQTIVFGDRFPLRYFVEEYNLTYKAAFNGCSEQSEASAKTIAYLINYVKENNIPVVFKIELSNGKIADTIARETGAKVLEFHCAHNITKKDFDDGLTYVDIMNKNIEALKIALN